MLDRFPEAVAGHRTAVADQRTALGLAPADLDHQEEMAERLFGLGICELRRGRLDDALAPLTEANERYSALFTRLPIDTEVVKRLANTQTSLASLDRRANRPAAGLPVFKQARELDERVARDLPDVLEFRSALAVHLNNMGAFYRQTGDLEKSADCFAQAVRHHRDAVSRAPHVRHYRLYLQMNYSNLVPILFARGRGDEAVKTVTEARVFWEQLIDRNPGRHELPSDLGALLNDLALRLTDYNRHDDAIATYRVALRHQEAAVALSPTTNEYRVYLERHFNNLAGLFVQSRRTTDLAELARQRAKFWPTDPDHLFVISRHFAECVGMAALAERDGE